MKDYKKNPENQDKNQNENQNETQDKTQDKNQDENQENGGWILVIVVLLLCITVMVQTRMYTDVVVIRDMINHYTLRGKTVLIENEKLVFVN